MLNKQDNDTLFKKICGILMRKNNYRKPEFVEQLEINRTITSRSASKNKLNKKVYEENLRLLSQLNNATSTINSFSHRPHMIIRKPISYLQNYKSVGRYMSLKENNSSMCGTTVMSLNDLKPISVETASSYDICSSDFVQK